VNTSQQKNNWFVYIILCSDNSLYTGISTDINRRFLQHKNKKGAKYFRARAPLKIVYYESGFDRSNATKREIHIKKLSSMQKTQLLNKSCNELNG